jgi:phosphoribosylaminoimidazolecarboxamide formyltransferase/IMP cyclohydrolase
LDHQRKKGHYPVIRRALISVYDKTGLDELAQRLAEAGVQIVSTGSTAAQIEELGVPVTRVEELTGFPECLDGRVKTLHPTVHAGLLADLRLDAHRAQLEQLGIEPFDLLVSNLYPFQQTVSSGASVEECVEQIDIGGPAMVRAAAKNHANVAVITSPRLYDLVISAVERGGFTDDERRMLAAKRSPTSPNTTVAVAEWTAQELNPSEQWWPDFAGLALRRAAVLRYGENRIRGCPLYASGRPGPGPVGTVGRQGDVLQQLPWTPMRRGVPRMTSRCPRSPSSSTRTRAGSPSAPTSWRRIARRTRVTPCRPTAA